MEFGVSEEILSIKINFNHSLSRFLYIDRLHTLALSERAKQKLQVFDLGRREQSKLLQVSNLDRREQNQLLQVSDLDRREQNQLLQVSDLSQREQK